MDWIKASEDNKPPLDVWVLVEYKNGLSYEAVIFTIDSDYGYCAAVYESYISINDVKQWCLIK